MRLAQTIKDRPLLHARLWLKAVTQVFRQRITMLWLFYFAFNFNKHEHNV
jgi:hypothetical protein